MNGANVEAILRSDICENDIENLKMVFELTDEQMESYIKETAEFFNEFNNPELENTHIKVVFANAVMKNNEINIGVNRQGNTYIKRKINFKKCLEYAYSKYVIGFEDDLDLLDEQPDEVQKRILIP